MNAKKKAVVVGAGIVGLAAARALAAKGYAVDVFEKSPKAVGASIRNFGMVWPIGQPTGPLYDRAMRSRRIWQELCEQAGVWFSPGGALQVACEQDELQVLEEFVAQNTGARSCRMLTASEASSLSPLLRKENVLGALYSADEMTVDPREAIRALPALLSEQYGVSFHFNTTVTAIEGSVVHAGGRHYEAQQVIVCGGQEFESLYPEVFVQSPVTKCKLQMMRSEVMPGLLQGGPAICGGLTLTHYASFSACASLPQLKQRIEAQYPEYVQWGIHVMLSQNGQQELVIGDSHEYGPVHDPFDQQAINTLILDYLHTFTDIPGLKIGQTWNGTYLKTIGATELVLHPEEGVTIVNGLGGAGMSLSFGLLEEVVAGL